MQLKRYKIKDSDEYLQAGMANARAAFEVAPKESRHRSFVLSNLGMALSHQYERTGDARILDEAITLATEAVSLTPGPEPGHGSGSRRDTEDPGEGTSSRAQQIPAHDKRIGRLANLGSLLYMRYKGQNKEADLTEATWLVRKAIDLAGPKHLDFKLIRGLLSTLLYSKFLRTSEATFLTDAITVMSEVIGITPSTHPERAAQLGNLSQMLFKKYEVTREERFLDESLFQMNESITATLTIRPDLSAIMNNPESSNMRPSPARSSDFATRLAIFAEIVLFRFRGARLPPDVDRAIEMLRKSARITPDGHPHLLRRLERLSGLLVERYQSFRNLRDWEEVVTLSRWRERLNNARRPSMTVPQGIAFDNNEQAGSSRDQRNLF
ncbi:hypothetical protein ONZ43_g3243 [Nemania bipapillata]|uniref:Uncharacterized protein n=1 Tax=Nemania bipapillata TaxID=110536 RepID=A0ACC2IXI4_9PEZI|nr:hypothetical protein ONZ43_g3243 [Nemania bipapillata]